MLCWLTCSHRCGRLLHLWMHKWLEVTTSKWAPYDHFGVCWTWICNRLCVWWLHWSLEWRAPRVDTWPLALWWMWTWCLLPVRSTEVYWWRECGYDVDMTLYTSDWWEYHWRLSGPFTFSMNQMPCRNKLHKYQNQLQNQIPITSWNFIFSSYFRGWREQHWQWAQERGAPSKEELKIQKSRYL